MKLPIDIILKIFDILRKKRSIRIVYDKYGNKTKHFPRKLS